MHSTRFSPIRSLLRFWRLGRPSRKRMRSINLSACFISSMDSSYSCLPARSKPQFLYILACRKYWFIAVSSCVSCLFNSCRTFLSPFIIDSPNSGAGIRVLAVAAPEAVERATRTTPAFGSDAQGTTQISQVTHPILGGLRDLAFGHGIADTDVHSLVIRISTYKRAFSPADRETTLNDNGSHFDTSCCGRQAGEYSVFRAVSVE